MFVNRLRMHGVRGMYRDIPDGGGPLPEAARRRLLLLGPNGSGKTTILETIRALWELFGEWIDTGAGQMWRADRDRRSHAVQSLLDSKLVAMELGDFPEPGKFLWIGLGYGSDWEKFKQRHPGHAFAGLDQFDGLGKGRVGLPPGDWKGFRNRSVVGSDPKPNIVSLPPDNRTVSVPPDGRPRLIDATVFGWSAAYRPELDLESALLTMQALRLENFDRTMELVNLALGHRSKRIAGWSEEGRLIVEGRTETGREYAHTVDRLSSGERQFLLMTAYVAGFLRPRGIVLLDEPDLHLNISLVTQLLQTLDLIVRDRGGQLLATSHSDRVEEFFARESEKLSLAGWQGGER